MLGINDDPVTIKRVEALDRRAGALPRRLDRAAPAGAADREAVAVVGSGPRALAAADQLNHAGHKVTVFERADRIGGLLRYGIPEFKLEKRHLDRRLALMEQEGVVFRAGCHIGVDVPTAALRRDFDAVVLCCGAVCPAGPPGARARARSASTSPVGLPRTSRTAAALTTRCRPATSSRLKAKRVVIIGGGDTGADCLGTAPSTGARSVHQFELLSRPPESRAADNPMAALAQRLPHLLGARRGRRARLLGLDRALRRRRRRDASARSRRSRST